MPSRHPRTAVASLAALALLSTGCAAFSEDSGGSGSAGGAPSNVVTAFYPLQYAAERVVGEDSDVEVTNLTQPGAEPHDLELSPALTAEIVEADVVVFEASLQPTVAASIEENATGVAFDVTEAVDLVPFEEGEAHAEDDHDHEGEDHEGEDHEGEEHEGEEHDHGDLDPHFWQDPARMADLGDALAEQLADLDPDRAEEYRTNAAGLREDLEQLDADFTSTLASCERDTVVVSHDAFGYLTKYGLEMEPIAGLSPDAEPTPADLAALQDQIEDEGITTVFYERLVSPRFSEALAADAGVETAVLDPLEGLSDETSGEDYVSLMRANLDALAQANGCA